MTYRIVSEALSRFWAKVQKTEGCWLWKASSNPAGYGHFWLNGSKVSAHRLSYELSVGPIGEGLYICHRCDTPSCVNPAHLFVGTPRENTSDMMGKGRHPFAVSVTHCKHGHEFTPENTQRQRSGTRQCRQCKRDRTNASRRSMMAVA